MPPYGPDAANELSKRRNTLRCLEDIYGRLAPVARSTHLRKQFSKSLTNKSSELLIVLNLPIARGSQGSLLPDEALNWSLLVYR